MSVMITLQGGISRCKYSADSAKNRLLMMPVACIRIGKPSDGTSHLLVMESVKGANYTKIRKIYCNCLKSIGSPSTLTKSHLN